MPDRTNDSSKTGKLKRSELEPRLRREAERSKNIPELPEQDVNSTTGTMRVLPEASDETAERDEDHPA